MNNNNGRKSSITGKKVYDYVDNKLLTQTVNEYNARYKERLAKGLKQEIMPDIIGHAILKIAHGVGSKHNFRNYTYIDEMIDDAIAQAVYAVTRFDGTKFDNAFGYFTLVIWRAMTSRIKEEKKQQKIIEDLMGDPNFMFYESDTNENDQNVIISKENASEFYWDGKL